MRRILVATDFSDRSDRAIARAAQLSQATGAHLVAMHAVDDDQPARLVEVQRRMSAAMLDELARKLRDKEGLSCEVRVELGDPFRAIAAAAVDADLAVLGPHRRDVLRDMFVGTTAERTIREGRCPVIMVNADPVGRYRRILVTSDLSDSSAYAARVAVGLGLLDQAEVLAMHAFAAPAGSVMLQGSMTDEELAEYVASERARAGVELSPFLRGVGLGTARIIIDPISVSVARTILACAKREQADLVVIGTRGRSGIRKLLLGSVAEEVLRDATLDILAVPPAAGER